MKVKVRCIETYNDTELNIKITNNSDDKNYERIVSKERADVLVKAGVCEILEVFNEKKIENAKLNDNKEVVRKKNENSKKEVK